MKIVAVDDEKLALMNVLEILRKVAPEAEVVGFDDSTEALEYVRSHGVDIAFLDIEMFGINGVDLAKLIKEKHPGVNIVFTTSYDEYIMDAMGMHASGYIMKPITEEKVRKEMSDLRYSIANSATVRKRITIKTFGNFEVYLDCEPVKFQYSKTKELLAYLIDRNGALASNGEIMGILWEDEGGTSGRNSYFKNIRTELGKLFKRAGMEEALVHHRGMMGILPERIECDYFDYLTEKENAVQAYRGEYMSQYSWAEYTNGNLYRSLEDS